MKLKRARLKKILKISEQFLMIDEVINVKPGLSGIGIKYINMDEWFFKGHFIDDPTMPSTLITEAMLQTNVAILYLKEKKTSNRIFITKSVVNNFDKINSKGTITIDSRIENEKKGVFQASSQVFLKIKKLRMEILDILIQNFF